MKKIITVFIILYIIQFFSFANADQYDEEIVFHGISWLSNRITTVEKMADLYDSEDSINYQLREEGIYLCRDERLNARPQTTRSYPNASKGLLFSDVNMREKTGHIIKNILFTYVCSESIEQLICVKIEFEDAGFDEIQQAFNMLYGNGVEIQDEEGIDTCIWYGANESCILLYSFDDKETMNIFYGYLSGEELLKASEMNR